MLSHRAVAFAVVPVIIILGLFALLVHVNSPRPSLAGACVGAYPQSNVGATVCTPWD